MSPISTLLKISGKFKAPFASWALRVLLILDDGSDVPHGFFYLLKFSTKTNIIAFF